MVFKVGDGDYALPADEVLQLESFEGATHVPGAPPYVTGIVQSRGRVVPVVDLRVRFQLPPAPRTLDTRIILVTVDGRVVGLLVDSAREVVTLPATEVAPPPRLVAERSDGFVRAVARTAGRLLMLIDTRNVIGGVPLP
ncbi:Positive regulator of CheA protein activity (CheW) [Chondromyces apiculatus DSM 436]|uniref:Positive regulator of CheA protein activity (CheW) n=1 Tax=Chondromyces apiculatus DSM 436 TaxID=1192034 RepID=A0A017T5X9_9BACT|nr:Positive regulator of CheA protein activity (CheW) [Chondromyces apiculatus DSM 436]